MAAFMEHNIQRQYRTHSKKKTKTKKNTHTHTETYGKKKSHNLPKGH